MLEEEQKMKKHSAEGFGAEEVWFSITAVFRTDLVRIKKNEIVLPLTDSSCSLHFEK